jgi:RNA polymerase sigma factor (sigma-70 family)
MALPPFQAFLDEHHVEVHRFLAAMVGHVEADDCFQETFLAALRAYGRLRPDSDLRAWVLTIAYRKAMDVHRSRARRPLPVPDPIEVVDATEPDIPDDGLWASVRALPDKQRAAVAARFVTDLPYADIGELLGCTPEAARRNVHEGLTTLRRIHA